MPPHKYTFFAVQIYAALWAMTADRSTSIAISAINLASLQANLTATAGIVADAPKLILLEGEMNRFCAEFL